MSLAGLRVAAIAMVSTIVAGGLATPCRAQTTADGAARNQTADQITVAATTLYGQARYTEAEPLFRQALALAEKTRGPNDLVVAAVLNNLASDIERQGRYAEAEAPFRRALAIMEKSLGPNHFGVAAELFKVARDLGEQGRYAQAEPLLRQALAIDEKSFGTDNASTAAVLNSLAWVVERQGRTAEAEVLFHRALAIDVKALGPDHPYTAAMLQGLAGNIVAQGRYVEAEPLFRRALAIDEKTFGPDHPETAIQLNNLAFDVEDQGRHAEAEPLFRRALAIDEKTLGPDHPKTATVLNDLAQDIAAQGRYAEAEPLYNHVVALDEKALGPDHPDTAFALYSLGQDIMRQGRYAEAEPLLRQAVAIDENTLGSDHPWSRDLHTRWGEALYLLGNHAGAVVALRNGCKDSMSGGSQIQNSQSELVAGSRAQYCSSRLARALWGWASQGGDPAARDSPEALKQEAFGQAQRATLSAAGDAMARSSALTAATQEGVGDLAARYEADLLAHDKLDSDFATAAGQGGPNGAGRAAALETARNAVAAEIASLAAQIKARSPHYWDFRSPEPVSLADLQGGAGQPSLLRSDEAVVLWMIPPGKEQGLAFAVSREGFAWARIGFSGEEIKAKVDRLRGQIDPHAYARGAPRRLSAVRDARDQGGDGFDRETAYELYQALLGDPKIQAVIGPKHTLLIAPSGPMWSLPPALLVTAKPPEGWVNNADPATLKATPWLLRVKAVALLPAVSSLRTLRQLLPKDRPASTDRLLALADPDFGNRASPAAGAEAVPRGMDYYVRGGTVVNGTLDLPRLPGTRVEALALAAALGAPASSVLTDADASKAQLMARNADGRLAKVKVLEFATHGLVTGDAGLAEPALALAKGGRPADELLLASEVTGLKINADWTLLSACNTASPDAPEAQGLSGLSRAFFFAGAVSVLVSHWSVDDTVTATLIPDALKRQAASPGLDRAEALRQASLAVLDEPGGRHVSPTFWAPFTLIGEPGPLAGR